MVAALLTVLLVSALVAPARAHESTAPPPRCNSVTSPPGAGMDWLDTLIEQFLFENPHVSDDPESRSALRETLRRSRRSWAAKRQAARGELLAIVQAARRYDVLCAYLPPARRGGRSPDMVLKLRGPGGSKYWWRVEVKTLTGYRFGRVHPSTRPSLPTIDRLISALRSGFLPTRTGRAAQLSHPHRILNGTVTVPARGTLTIVVPHGKTHKVRARVTRAVAQIATQLADPSNAFIEVIEVMNPGGQLIANLLRQPDGSYLPDPRSRRQLEDDSVFDLPSARPACFVGTCHVGRAHATTSALERAMTQMQAAPGGIDLSSVELSYLSLGSEGDDAEIEYAFQIERGRATASLTDGLANARQASDAFFVWLALRRSTFWVNLKPDEPDRIVDPQLGRTMVGKVMLEADLELKRADARLIRPSSRFGGRVWAATDGCIPSRRLWISPGTARVHEDGDSLYILDTPLEVNVEPWAYRPGPGDPRPPGAELCQGLSDPAIRRNVAIYRRHVEPRLTRTVNRAPQFAALRRVYRSRVAAEWYRDRSENHDTLFGPIIDSGRVRRWSGTGGWRPRETFRAYLSSWSKGEYRDTYRDGSTSWTVVIGGVDFGDVPSRAVDADALAREHPGLEAAVRQAVTRGTPALSGSQGYLGSTGTVDRAVIKREFPAERGKTDGPADAAGRSPAVYGAIALVAAGVLLVGFAAARRVRRGAAGGAA